MKTKTRSFNVSTSSSPEFLIWEQKQAPYLGIQSGPSYPEESLVRYSETLVGDTTKGRSRFNPVFHTRVSKVAVPGTIVVLPNSTSPNWRCVLSQDRAAADIYKNQSSLSHHVLSEAEWSSLNAEALQNMLPAVSDGFSLVNFLIELKDFRKLWSSFMERKGRLSTIVTGSSSYGGDLGKALKKRTVSQVSGSYLNYSFAWAPFVQDIQTMWQKAWSVDQKLADIWKRASTPQTRHFTRQVYTNDLNGSEKFVRGAPLDAGVVDPNPPYTASAAYWYRRERRLEAGVYHATMRYTYKVPGVLGARNTIKGYMDALGVRLDPSIIWNAIPLSFLLDWVVNVGGFLRRFSVDNLGLVTTIEDFCSSWKSETVVDVAVGHLSTWETADPDNLNQSRLSQIGFITDKYYERRTDLPGLFNALSTSNLNVRKAALGAALVGSRARF
jgi:hypothetical protein